MTENSDTSIYEKAFAKSHKTDAILVVEGKKLHVNKAFLSFHSDYFDTLFNGDFKEKTMPEIEIKDVKFEEFAGVLSLVLPNPIIPKETDTTKLLDLANKLLQLAEQFLLPGATRFLDCFLVSTKLYRQNKLELADKYDLEVLLKHAVSCYSFRSEIFNCSKEFQNYSKNTKAALLDRLFVITS